MRQMLGIDEPTPVKTGKSGMRGWALVPVLSLLLACGCNKPGAHVQADPGYVAQLQFGRLQLSESSSLSGGKSTYVDGVVRNMGSSTVQAVTVQVSFPADPGVTGVGAHVVTLPLTLIRTREPYVDVQTVAADPMLPGKTREFRLVFEGTGKDGVGPDWNQQLPEVKASAVSTLCISCR